MAGTYTNITEAEMKAFLEPLGFKLLNIPGTTELVFGKRVHCEVDPELPLTLRIYTGIAYGHSREKGEDAIRPVVFFKNRKGEVKLFTEGKRVHRIETWRKNLKQRIDSIKELLPVQVCHCGAPMKVRQGPHGDFYGCTNYPDCKGVKQIEQSK